MSLYHMNEKWKTVQKPLENGTVSFVFSSFWYDAWHSASNAFKTKSPEVHIYAQHLQFIAILWQLLPTVTLKYKKDQTRNHSQDFKFLQGHHLANIIRMWCYQAFFLFIFPGVRSILLQAHKPKALYCNHLGSTYCGCCMKVLTGIFVVLGRLSVDCVNGCEWHWHIVLGSSQATVQYMAFWAPSFRCHTCNLPRLCQLAYHLDMLAHARSVVQPSLRVPSKEVM